MPSNLDKLQGTWWIRRLEMDGRKVPAAAIGDAHIILSGAKFRSVSMGSEYEGRVELDGRRKPARIDLVFTAGPEEGTRNPGIYKISARNWTICLATQGNVRPKTFATKAGSGLALQTLERTAGKPSMRPGRSASPAPPQVARSSPPTATTPS